MSFRRKVRSSNCPFDRKFVGQSAVGQSVHRQNVRSAKCPFGKMSFGKVSFGKMSDHHLLEIRKFVYVLEMLIAVHPGTPNLLFYFRWFNLPYYRIVVFEQTSFPPQLKVRDRNSAKLHSKS